MKGLLCSILSNPVHGNCSNGGISSEYTEVLLVPDYEAGCGFGIPEIFAEHPSRPTVVLRTRKVGDKEYLRAVPIELSGDGQWSMAGGSFIWNSDSRFPADYPIPLHDRQEN